MSEAEWLTRTTPTGRLKAAWDRLTERHCRLFATGCCRLIWDRMTDPRSRRAVDVAERYADGAASLVEILAAHESAQLAVAEADECCARYAAETAVAASEPVHPQCLLAADCSELAVGYRRVRGPQNALVTDLLGDPFHPRPVAPAVLAWNGGAVAALARSICAAQDFSRLPALAEALVAAGCDHPGLVGHCRSPGPHFRGCWALDLLLGRTT